MYGICLLTMHTGKTTVNVNNNSNHLMLNIGSTTVTHTNLKSNITIQTKCNNFSKCSIKQTMNNI